MSKFAISEADLRLFVVLWNQRHNLDTPDIHLKMATWLEHNWERGNKNLLLMAFRSSGKSTIAALFVAWLLYRNPDLRILVLAADLALSKKMVRNVKNIIERHPLTPQLKPDKPDQWAGERFSVKRYLPLRDPSVMARGVSSNITGSRADIVICDDVEVPGTCDSASKREDLRDRLSEMSYVLVPGGSTLYIGTPHSYFSIYAKEPRKEIGEEEAFLAAFKRLEIPVLDDEGQSVWPERYSRAALAHMKRQSGPNKFESQMMLKPVNIAQGRLDPSLIQFYEEDLNYVKELQTLFIGDTKMVSASAFWDPAFGSANGDHSVLAVIFSDNEGNAYLHHLEYIKLDEGSDIDEAHQQCDIVAVLIKRFYIPRVSVETNGLGAFLPSILKNTLVSKATPCAVQKVNSTRAKDIRILEAFDALLASQRLYVHKSVLQTPFMSEMQDWRPERKYGHDDGLDAVAGALGQEPLRLKRLYGRGAFSWMNNTKSHKAKTEFDV